MNKVMVAAIVSGLAGAGCYFAFGQTILSFLPQLNSIPQQLPNVIKYIQENLAALGITAGSFLTLGILAVSQVWKNVKANIQQAATQKVSEAQNQTLEAASENQSLHQTITQLQTENTILQEANQNVAALQQDKIKLEAQVQTLINEKNEAERMLTALIPKKEEKPPVH